MQLAFHEGPSGAGSFLVDVDTGIDPASIRQRDKHR